MMTTVLLLFRLRSFSKPASALFRGGAPHRPGQASLTLATVFSQEGDQLIHRGEFSGVADEAAFPLPANESHAAEVSQMEGQRGRRQDQLLADGAGVHSVRAGLHQQAKNRQTRFMAKSGEEFRSV